MSTYEQFDRFRDRLKKFKKGDLVSKLDFQTQLDLTFARYAVLLGILEDPGYNEAYYVKGTDLANGLSSEEALGSEEVPGMVDSLVVQIPDQLGDSSIENQIWVEDLVYRTFKPKELQDLFFGRIGGQRDLDCLGFRLFRVKAWNACVQEMAKYLEFKKDKDSYGYEIPSLGESED